MRETMAFRRQGHYLRTLLPARSLPSKNLAISSAGLLGRRLMKVSNASCATWIENNSV